MLDSREGAYQIGGGPFVLLSVRTVILELLVPGLQLASGLVVRTAQVPEDLLVGMTAAHAPAGEVVLYVQTSASGPPWEARERHYLVGDALPVVTTTSIAERLDLNLDLLLFLCTRLADVHATSRAQVCEQRGVLAVAADSLPSEVGS